MSRRVVLQHSGTRCFQCSNSLEESLRTFTVSSSKIKLFRRCTQHSNRAGYSLAKSSQLARNNYPSTLSPRGAKYNRKFHNMNYHTVTYLSVCNSLFAQYTMSLIISNIKLGVLPTFISYRSQHNLHVCLHLISVHLFFSPSPLTPLLIGHSHG